LRVALLLWQWPSGEIRGELRRSVLRDTEEQGGACGEGHRRVTRPVFGLLLVVAAVLQTALLPRWQLLAVTPGLVVVLLLAWSAYRGIPEALAWVFVAGFVLDVLGLDRLGANALALLPVALLGGLSRGRFFHSALVFPMALAMAGTFIYVGTLLALRGLLGEGGDASQMLGRVTVLQALLNALLVPPVFGFIGWLQRMEPERT
jgi:rod shape-determining protein MreD